LSSSTTFLRERRKVDRLLLLDTIVMRSKVPRTRPSLSRRPSPCAANSQGASVIGHIAGCGSPQGDAVNPVCLTEFILTGWAKLMRRTI
jgi:hypothetical protein